MNIGGIQKTSLIDYPGKLSCVLFLTGCNFNCPYCHNPDLVRGKSRPAMDQDQLTAFLSKRRRFLEGVVITGGEPTLQADLPELCYTLKSMGFSVKLDTNGSHPEMLKQLMAEQLIDFVAMDIKTDPERYVPNICRTCNPSDIIASAQLILASSLSHEFRTTCVLPLVDQAAIDGIAQLIDGAGRHALQRVQHESVNVLCPEFFKTHNWFIDDTVLEHYQSVMAAHVGTCVIR